MNDEEIQFGEVEEAPAQPRRRPDRDRHFAVVDYGTFSDGELPIFVDVDVLADMEAHAQTDTSVELGGVVLGGQYVDEEGNPFVVISDSLRAEHYESSRGHFKFTHDTWTRISRQRDEFSDDLQMVGWYHTHPDWGVFLSGMDRFICDHFFNRPLDVALVIDPIRNDRGWFFWQPDGNERLPQSGGFRVTASRFRRRELAAYVARLEGRTTMKPDYSFGGPPGTGLPGTGPAVSTEVIHTIRPQMGWLGIAILAILFLQACLTLLVALRLGDSGPRDDSQPRAGQAAVDRPPTQQQQPLAVLQEELRREFDLRGREQRLDARRRLLDEMLGHVQVGPDGQLDMRTLVEEYRSQRQEIDRLAKTDFLLAQLTEDHRELKQQRDELTARVGELQRANARHSQRTDELSGKLRQATESRDRALAKLDAAQAEIDRLKSPSPEAGQDETKGSSATADDTTKKPGSGVEKDERRIPTWCIILGLVAVLIAAAVIAVVIIRRKRRYDRAQAEPAPRSDEP